MIGTVGIFRLGAASNLCISSGSRARGTRYHLMRDTIEAVNAAPKIRSFKPAAKGRPALLAPARHLEGDLTQFPWPDASSEVGPAQEGLEGSREGAIACDAV